MRDYVVVDPIFDGVWPLAADHLRRVWDADGPDVFVRLDGRRTRTLCEVIDDPGDVERLVSLGVETTDTCLNRLSNLSEAFLMTDSMYSEDEALCDTLRERGVEVHSIESQGHWGQSVAEFALGLTIAGLRRIPQQHREILHSHAPWDQELLADPVRGARGHQFADDPSFANGTVAGTSVRVVGVGNVGSRFADFADTMGADVAAYDPYADESCFHRTGARRVRRVTDLLGDAEVFAPLVPLTDATEGLITAGHVQSLPEGALVVLVTRAEVCDVPALRERVLADELALAADVWDEEPLPLDDPLLGRHNVVHTPHVAGRTRHANEQLAETIASQFCDAGAID